MKFHIITQLKLSIQTLSIKRILKPEKRVKKRVEKPKQSDEEKVVSEEITTEPLSTSTLRPHIQLEDLAPPRFVDAEAELDKELLVMTSSGSLYGRKAASSKGLTCVLKCLMIIVR